MKCVLPLAALMVAAWPGKVEVITSYEHTTPLLYRPCTTQLETAARLDPLVETAKHNLRAARARLEQTGERGAIR